MVLKQSRAGFTLIELMIVIAIIAVIAAIAIPGLLASQRASNERNASASLKTITAAEADFRGNDRDGNKVQDFWVQDLAQLYALDPMGSSEPIKLIDISIAGADTITAAVTPPGTPSSCTGISNYITPGAKAGYWFRPLVNDEAGNAYGQPSTVLAANVPVGALAASSWNTMKFGFMAFPDTRTQGKTVFIVNENNTIFKRGVNSTYNPAKTGAGMPQNTEPATAELVGPSPSLNYPTDANLKADYSKLD